MAFQIAIFQFFEEEKLEIETSPKCDDDVIGKFNVEEVIEAKKILFVVRHTLKTLRHTLKTLRHTIIFENSMLSYQQESILPYCVFLRFSLFYFRC